MGQLDGRLAIVTGAGQGVGRGTALALATEGAAVAVIGRTEAKLVETCDEIRRRGGRGHPVVGNAHDGDDIQRMVGESVEALGGVDILVNNANVYARGFGPLLSIADEHLVKSFMAGPVATLRFMKACHPHMKARGRGDIINLVSSAMVRWDARSYGLYAAYKQAVRSLTRAAACEWAPDGIRALNVAPHAMSPGLKAWTEANPVEAAEFIKTIPAGRIGDCELDIGRGIVTLLSKDLAYLTGATIPLDGGQAYFG
ncbi:MAG: SDR family oxidoreductase [Steroidobacteraceae bacterium]|nr:SDR family oxidoreductase [Steroidobacteraceae bacterium]MBP7015223.1 SDR family oxidoreductase [Steroidobacteraceae bacterium]